MLMQTVDNKAKNKTISAALLKNILDSSLEAINNKEYAKAVLTLQQRLGKFTMIHGTEEVQGWIQDYCLSHPVTDMLMQSPFTKRCMDKPKGYAGDATLIDYIYRIGDLKESHTPEGKSLHDTLIMSSSCEAVRWRAQHLGEEINAMYEKKARKISAISIASGHLRELEHVKNFEDKIENFIGLDQDKDSNAQARKFYPYKNLFIFDECIKYVLTRKLPAESFDLVYSTGLFDYLDAKLSARMTSRMFELVNAGGSMIIPNFAKNTLEQGYMECFMDWYLTYRDEIELFDFMSELDMDQVASYQIYGDQFGNILYLKVTKK
jgi:extracellular factor (EF) 3-hydroxypalmitic acid methyl ester biosynthesis protein